MKKIIVLLMAGCFFTAAASAQAKPTGHVKAVQTVKISTPTLQCDMCKSKIETYLKRIDGVGTVNVNVKKKETTVKFFTDRTNIEEIKTGIANVGYDADDVFANEESYKKLPRCCKKPEDRGGMKN